MRPGPLFINNAFGGTQLWQEAELLHLCNVSLFCSCNNVSVKRCYVLGNVLGTEE